jgi:hypothetical protein
MLCLETIDLLHIGSDKSDDWNEGAGYDKRVIRRPRNGGMLQSLYIISLRRPRQSCVRTVTLYGVYQEAVTLTQLTGNDQRDS